MSAEALQVFEEYVKRFNQALSGEEVDPFVVFDPACPFTLTGHADISGKYENLQAVQQAVFGRVMSLMKVEPGFGFYIEECFGDGDRMVALMRGRGESKLGRPYNNVYFFVFEVKDGKIVQAVEDCDASLVMWSISDMNLVPKNAPRC